MQTEVDLKNLLPAFLEPVLDSQRAFRSILDGMAHPGKVVNLGMDLNVPKPLHRATAAACLTLLDFETPLWTDLPESSEALAWLRFHCGCPLVHDPTQASFAVVTRGETLSSLDAFNIGDQEFPERSATVMIQVFLLSPGSGKSLKGPGIETVERVAVHGLPGDFWMSWRINRRLYPLGVDLLLTSGTALVAVPRTTEVGD